MNKQIAGILYGMLGGVVSAFLFMHYRMPAVLTQQVNSSSANAGISEVQYHNTPIANGDFIKASKVATPTVVFIKTLTNQQNYVDPFFDFWSGMVIQFLGYQCAYY